MSTLKWEVGQTVDVQSRTWAGINKPGGCAKVIKVHFTEDGANIEALDVKYVLSGGNEKKIDPAIVSRFEVLEPRGRKRRGRDFLMEQADNVVKTITGKKFEATKNKGAIMEKPSQKKTQTKSKRQQQKEPEPSPQSTSPSTPVTPEHPSSRPPKVKKITPVVKKMTPVPSYVLAGGIVEVSPLPLGHRSSKKSTTKPAVARRGLFGSSEPTKVVLKTKASKVEMPETELAAASTKSVKVDDKKPFAAVSLKTNKSKLASKEDSKKPAKKETLVRPLSMNTERRKPMPTQVPKLASKPILSLPRPKSAKQHPVGSHKPLKACFDYEVKKAREFLDEVCGARDDDVVDSSANENRTLDSKPAASSRYEDFLSIFRTLRRKIDDGTINEAEFRTLVNQQAATKPFSVDEVNTHIEALCEEGKVMKSDGNLYIID